MTQTPKFSIILEEKLQQNTSNSSSLAAFSATVPQYLNVDEICISIKAMREQSESMNQIHNNKNL